MRRPLSLEPCLACLPGDKEVSVVAIDYDSFAIMEVILHQGASSLRVLKLYSKPRRGPQGAVLYLCPGPAPPHCGGPSSDMAGESWEPGGAGRVTGGGSGLCPGPPSQSAPHPS